MSYRLGRVSIMKENIFSMILFLLEMCIFCGLSILVGIPSELYVKLGVIWFIVMFIFNHYKVQSTLVWEEIRSDIKALLSFWVISFTVLFPNASCFYKIAVIAFFMCVLSVLLNRTLRLMLRSWMARKTLIIGTGRSAYRVGKIANNNRFSLTDVVGFIKYDDDFVDELYDKENKFKIYDFDELDNILNTIPIKQAIIAVPSATRKEIDELSKKLFNKVQIVKVLPQLNFTMTFNSWIDDYDGELLISTARGKITTFEKAVKRMIDIIAGLVGCTLLIPLTIYVSYKNKIHGDTDPIFFKQKRIGINGKTIQIYKYRSMIPDAEKYLEELMKNNPKIKEEYLINKKLVNDPRITEVGKFLRKSSLDEFPQFINVLKGEMSLVGPRPYLPREKSDMDFYYDSIIKCKPGITGMWQANGRSDVGFEERCKLDDYYYRNWSIGLDMIIIYKTIKAVLYGKGAI